MDPKAPTRRHRTARLGVTLAAALALPLLLTPARAPAEVVERIVAVVNQQIVLLSELRERMLPMKAQLKQIPDKTMRAQRADEMRRQLLDMIISEKLIVQEANKLKLSVSDKDLERAVGDVMSKNNLSRKELEEFLAQEGKSISDYKLKILKPQLLRLRVLNIKVRSRLSVSDDEVRTLYQKNLRALGVETKVRARHIFVAVPAAADAAELGRRKARVQGLLAQVKAEGADFAAIAKKNSDDPVTREDGGDLGFFSRGTLPSNIEDIVFAMKKGEIKGPLRTDRGYHVILMVERKESAARSFDEVKNRLRNTIYGKKMEKATQAWINEVRKRAHIDLRL